MQIVRKIVASGFALALGLWPAQSLGQGAERDLRRMDPWPPEISSHDDLPEPLYSYHYKLLSDGVTKSAVWTDSLVANQAQASYDLKRRFSLQLFGATVVMTDPLHPVDVRNPFDEYHVQDATSRCLYSLPLYGNEPASSVFYFDSLKSFYVTDRCGKLLVHVKGKSWQSRIKHYVMTNGCGQIIGEARRNHEDRRTEFFTPNNRSHPFAILVGGDRTRPSHWRLHVYSESPLPSMSWPLLMDYFSHAQYFSDANTQSQIHYHVPAN